jgi:hypothetical protein
VVLVTGACGDIGKAICLRLARSRLKDPAFDDFKVKASICCLSECNCRQPACLCKEWLQCVCRPPGMQHW